MAVAAFRRARSRAVAESNAAAVLAALLDHLSRGVAEQAGDDAVEPGHIGTPLRKRVEPGSEALVHEPPARPEGLGTRVEHRGGLCHDDVEMLVHGGRRAELLEDVDVVAGVGAARNDGHVAPDLTELVDAAQHRCGSLEEPPHLLARQPGVPAEEFVQRSGLAGSGEEPLEGSGRHAVPDVLEQHLHGRRGEVASVAARYVGLLGRLHPRLHRPVGGSRPAGKGAPDVTIFRP